MLKISHSAISSLLYAMSVSLRTVTGGCPQHHAIYNIMATEASTGVETLAPFLKQLALIADRKRAPQYLARLAEYFAAYDLPNELDYILTPERQRRALIALQMAFEAAVGPESFGLYECRIATPNHAEALNLIQLLIDLREVEA